MNRQVGEKSPEMILLAGSSVRAAANSCQRAGLACLAIDRFADFDLRRACMPNGVIAIQHWSDLPKFASTLPHCPWMYTGPLENRPEIVDAVSESRPLCGNSAEVLRRVRDPAQLAKVLQSLNLPFPRTWDHGNAYGTFQIPAMPWISKSPKAAGGLHVRLIPEDKELPREASMDPGDANRILQSFVPGLSVSGLFCAQNSETKFLGMTQQWHKQQCIPLGSEAESLPFAYLGSVGPIELSAELAGQWVGIGKGIADAFSLQGLFGVDAILHTSAIQTQIVTLEVNPRYTASVEVLERATQKSLIQDHMACFYPARNTASKGLVHTPVPVSAFRAQSAGRVAGKGILYATHPLSLEHRHIEYLMHLNEFETWPVVCDIPMPNVELASGDPVLSVHATGTHEDEVVSAIGFCGGGMLSRISQWLSANS